MPLTESVVDVRHYQDAGIVHPIRVLTPDEVAHYRSLCDEMEARLGGKPRTIEVRQMHLHLRWPWELATHPRVLDAVEAILGPNLLVWATELFAKHPEDKTISIEWHRDRPYMGFEDDGIVTAWIALSDSNPANGCMQALPGADRRIAERDGTPPVDISLRAGEMSLHDADVLHGSSPNRSEHKRVGFVVRYITPDTRGYDDHSPVLVARGKAPQDGFRIVEPPRENDWDRSLPQIKRSAAEHLDIILQNLQRAEG